jgi:hypothetical protein
MLNMLRTLQKNKVPDTDELISDLVYTVGEISKIFYTKAQGIDPIFMKGLLQLYSSLLKEPSS